MYPSYTSLKPLNLSSTNMDCYKQLKINLPSSTSSSSISECSTPTALYRLPSFSEGFLKYAEHSDNVCTDNHCKLPSVQNLLALSFPIPFQNGIHNTSSFPHQFSSSIMKRPRRRSHEIARRYPCIHPGCGKAYGALNHLNAHIVSKKHGPKRAPQEFQALRNALKEQAKYTNDPYLNSLQNHPHYPY